MKRRTEGRQKNKEKPNKKIKTNALESYFDSDLLPIPLDVMFNKISPYLERRPLSALRSTCAFFAKDNRLESLWKSKPKLQLHGQINHHFILYENGRLFVWGFNDHSQLGLGKSIRHQLKPQEIIIQDLADDESILSFSLGSTHSFILTNKGRLFGCGSNLCGQLGLALKIEEQEFFEEIIINDLDKNEVPCKVIAKESHSFVLTTKGHLYGAGNNNLNQLSLVDTIINQSSSSITPFTDLTPKIFNVNEYIEDIHSAHGHSLIQTNQNRLFGWGHNIYGQLGLNHIQPAVCTPEEINQNFLKPNEKIKEIHLSCFTTYILTSMNRIFGAGSNLCCQLGYSGPGNIQFSEIIINELKEGEFVFTLCTGDHHLLMLTNKNRLFGCGSNSFGQLGFSSEENPSITLGYPRIAKYSPLKAVPVSLNAEEKMTALFGGNTQSFFLTNQKRFLVAGKNRHNQLLGDANITEQEYFIPSTLPTSSEAIDKELRQKAPDSEPETKVHFY